MNKVDVGIVGLGTIAKRLHIPALSSFGDVRIKAVAEVDIKRGKKTAGKWNIPEIYEDYNEMYEKAGLDCVFVCLPNFLHYDAIGSALAHDIHVFCEKPMGLRSDNAFELVTIARKKSLVLAVGYNKRLEANFEKSVEITKSLRLGDILQAHAILVGSGPYAGWIPSSDWFFSDRYGVLYDLGSHLIDLIIYILSDRITEVSAVGVSTMYGVNVYDNIAGTFKTEKGTIGTLNVGWKVAAEYSAIQVYGTAGSLFASPFEIEVRHGSHGALENAIYHLKCAKKFLKMRPSEKGLTTVVREDRAFIDSVHGNAKPLVSGEDGLRVLEVLDAIAEALNRGGEKRNVSFHEL
jgi:predicted dehydrogenase